MTGRFLQIHSLTSYPATLLNRDDVGFAKRIPFGGAVRTRVSSQCLKRHWRRSDSEYSLSQLAGGQPMSLRSRRIFEKEIYKELVDQGANPAVVRAACEQLLGALLPEGKGKQGKKGKEANEESPEVARTEQVIVLGQPEVDYLRGLVAEIAREAPDAKAVEAAAKDRFKDKELKRNLETLRLHAGLDAALFGRMVTGDVLARCDAAIHVAHTFTVHAGDFETDYFSAVDDLLEVNETGSGHINTAELTTGLFYGYVVVDVPLLVSNLEGCAPEDWKTADRRLAADIAANLIHLIATESPGAKRGATAPYSRASLVTAELGDTQPRTFANAFLDPVSTSNGGLARATYAALANHVGELDAMYGKRETRRTSGLPSLGLAAGDPLVSEGEIPFPIGRLAEWVAANIRGAQA